MDGKGNGQDTVKAGEHSLKARRVAALSALFVFVGGVSYGFVGPFIKLASNMGYTWRQIMASQSYGGTTLFIVAFAISLLFGRRWQKVSLAEFASLLLLGASAACTNLCYNICLTSASASLGVTLLFQYVWMGIAIQSILTRKPPLAMEVIAAVVVLAGTVGASGILDGGIELNLPGLLGGLGAALCYALFLVLSGRFVVAIPALQRGFITGLGSSAVATLVCPNFFLGGVNVPELAPFGLLLGCCALFLPVLLIGFGAPHISVGACNILASSELPSAFLSAALILGEPIGPVRLVGMVVILAGIALTQFPVGKNSQANQDAPKAS